MNIEFDPTKDERNRANHGISLFHAAELDWDTALLAEDTRIDYGEQRFSALGLLGQRVYATVFTMRGDTMRIISLRKANKREVKRYDKG